MGRTREPIRVENPAEFPRSSSTTASCDKQAESWMHPFSTDFLRNAAGHQWDTEPLLAYLTQNQAICATMYAVDNEMAAEALLEYLKQNQEICAANDGVDAEHARS